MANKLNSYKLDTELGDYMANHVHFYNHGMNVYPDQDGCLPVYYKGIEDDILNLKVRPDDIWIITFLKCGTTWSQEMIWMIVNDLDYEGAKVSNSERVPYLEFPGLSEEVNELLELPKDNPLRVIKKLKSPRIIKSHLPLGLLPRQIWEVKPKIIYVMREPKDVAASFYNHYRIVNGYTGTKEKFFESLISGELLTGPYWSHVAPFWKLRHQPNILINTFEEMKKDLPSVIHRTAKFLDKSIPEDKMKKLLEYLHFSNMKDNDSTNMKRIVDTFKKVHGVAKDENFMNKGNIGNYKENMSSEWIKRFDDWKYQEKIKHGLTDEEFPY